MLCILTVVVVILVCTFDKTQMVHFKYIYSLQIIHSKLFKSSGSNTKTSQAKEGTFEEKKREKRIKKNSSSLRLSQRHQ